jgi:hypothetical protein
MAIDTTHQFYYVDVVDPSLKDLDQQSYGHNPQGTYDCFPQVASCMRSFIGPKVLIGGSNSL